MNEHSDGCASRGKLAMGASGNYGYSPKCDCWVEERRRAFDVRQRIFTLLENEFGGFYLSAPADSPLGQVREILRAGRVS